MSVTTSTPSSGSPTVPRLTLGSALLVGAVVGATGIGFGLLTNLLIGLVSGRGTGVDGMPTWVWWLAVTVTGSPNGVPVLVVALLATLVVGVLAALVSRRRALLGLILLAVAGVAGAYTVWSTDSGRVEVLVPVVAALSAGSCLWLLLRGGRTEQGSDDDGEQEPAAPAHALPRRRAVLVMGGIAVAAATAGLLGSGPASTPVRRPTTGPRPGGGGEPLLRGQVVDVRDVGAIGDGVADDTAAITAALATVNRAGGTLHFPAGTYRYQPKVPLNPAANVVLSGVPGASTIDFTLAGAAGFALMLGIAADNVTVDGLVLRRSGPGDAVMVGLGEFQGFAFTRSALVGNADQFPDNYCHGFKLGDDGVASGFHMADSSITSTSYGLFQTNASTLALSDVRVERCSFSANRNTDLEFNSPSGSTRFVRVTECSFADNDSPGFGVGLANVADTVISTCTFDNYAMEAVHIEDYSAGTVVQDNHFTACGLRKHSNVQIISGANDVQLLGNTFDASSNGVPIFVVTAQPGGVGVTGGGRPVIPPSDVLVRGNTFLCSDQVTAVYLEATTGVTITGNTLSGPGLTDLGSTFEGTGMPAAQLRDNTINGRGF